MSGEDAAADLLIVGAGAKAAAIAAKVHVLNELGLGPIALTIVEATEPAASWSGRNGMTSGEEPLAIPPIKDAGFPYESHDSFGEQAGDAVDRAMMDFTWQRYMIERRRYVRWVNAGSPSIQHRTYGKYLAWVLERARTGVKLVHGRVTRISLHRPSERWRIEVADCTDSPWYEGRALALTGPGVHRPFPHDPEAARRIFHCDSRRIELARIPIEGSADIAIVGGGESALSCVAFLRGFRPDAQMTVYTPTLPLSRGESFLENRVFSNPDSVAWGSLDEQTRRDFVRHCDRGVFDPQTLQSIAYDDHCRFVTGRVRYVSAVGREGVCVEYDAAGGQGHARAHDAADAHGRAQAREAKNARGQAEGQVRAHDAGGTEGQAQGQTRVREAGAPSQAWARDAEGAEARARVRHDYVVNCTGFDLLEQLRSLFPPAVRAQIEDAVGVLWDRPPGVEIPVGRSLELEGMRPRLYIPGLGALSQGPGFANLGSLGLLANRVLEPLVVEKGGGQEPVSVANSHEVNRSAIREVV
jgi:mycobactin lysine-N-oxygenase